MEGISRMGLLADELEPEPPWAGTAPLLFEIVLQALFVPLAEVNSVEDKAWFDGGGGAARID